jgi:glycolate oxidase FAD binding subunit
MVSIPAALAPIAVEDADPIRYAIGGCAPEWILAPRSVAEAAAVLDAARAAGMAVAPLGGGTGLGELAAPVQPFVALLTGGLAGPIAHEAPDMTVVTGAGTTLAELGRVLARGGQRLPIAFPDDERATVGGLIAGDRLGPLRLGHGTVRDYLIGITVLDARGRRVHAGGRVVKNVAGYDLMKLHTGARGTLGLILEAVFKVTPLPAGLAVALAESSPEAAALVRGGLARAQVPAVALELAIDAGGETGELAIGIEGVPAEVDWQLARVEEVVKNAGGGPIRILRAQAAGDFLRHLVVFGATDEGRGDPAHLRVRGAVLPSRVSDLVRAWQAAAPGARLLAGMGTGIVRIAVKSEHPPALVGALRAAAVERGGHARVEALPAGFDLRPIDRFGVAADPLAIRLKAALDPTGLWLPGAYLGLGSGVGAGREGGGPA